MKGTHIKRLSALLLLLAMLVSLAACGKEETPIEKRPGICKRRYRSQRALRLAETGSCLDWHDPASRHRKIL